MKGDTTARARLLLAWAWLALLAVAACGTAEPTPGVGEPRPSATSHPADTAKTDAEPSATPPRPTEASAEERTAVPTELPATAAPTEPPEEFPLPPERQPVSFAAEDGQALEGFYYPAAVNPAPVVVLMHWARGDDSSWVEIAYWLQDRGLGGDTTASEPWLDPSWFRPMPDGLSLAVFTFTFRGCGGGSGCQSFEPEGWLLDATAAMDTARELEGVDPARAVAIGASIGSDGASDACADGCRGAVALSPGGYLNVPFAEAVKALDSGDPPRPVWCLAAEGDRESAPTCVSASGDFYRAILYPGSDHGMMLIRPGTDPDTLELILEFLDLTLGGR